MPWRWPRPGDADGNHDVGPLLRPRGRRGEVEHPRAGWHFPSCVPRAQCTPAPVDILDGQLPQLAAGPGVTDLRGQPQGGRDHPSGHVRKSSKHETGAKVGLPGDPFPAFRRQRVRIAIAPTNIAGRGRRSSSKDRKAAALPAPWTWPRTAPAFRRAGRHRNGEGPEPARIRALSFRTNRRGRPSRPRRRRCDPAIRRRRTGLPQVARSVSISPARDRA